MTADRADTQAQPAPALLIIYSEGVHELPPVQFTGDCYGLSVSYDVSQFTDPNSELIVELWRSTDGGATWEFGGGSTDRGEINRKDPQGILITTGWLHNTAFFNEYNQNKKFVRRAPVFAKDPLVKVIMRVSGAPIKTSMQAALINTVAQPDPALVPDLHHSIGVGVHVSAGSTGSTITTGSVTTQSSGSTFVLGNGYYIGGSSTFTSNTDSKSNGYSAVSVPEVNNANVIAGQERYIVNGAGGAGHTFTLTCSGTAYPAIAMTEITGADTSTPFDKKATSTDASGTSHVSANTATLSQAAEFILGTGIIGTASSGTVANPWIGLEAIANGATEGIVTAYQIVAATTAVAFTWTSSVSSLACTWVSTWKEAAGGGAATPWAQRFSRIIGAGAQAS